MIGGEESIGSDDLARELSLRGGLEERVEAITHFDEPEEAEALSRPSDFRLKESVRGAELKGRPAARPESLAKSSLAEETVVAVTDSGAVEIRGLDGDEGHF